MVCNLQLVTVCLLSDDWERVMTLETRNPSRLNDDTIFAVTQEINVKNGAAKRIRFQH